MRALPAENRDLPQQSLRIWWRVIVERGGWNKASGMRGTIPPPRKARERGVCEGMGQGMCNLSKSRKSGAN